MGIAGGCGASGWRKLLAGCVLGTALVAGMAQAAPIPLEGRQVDMTAREQPIASFLQDFFGTLDMPVSVSSNAKGAVNGVFRGPADRVLANILRSFGLMAYYDGAVVHVYTPGEISTRTFAMRQGNASAVIGTARDMHLTDARNTLRVSENGALIASGNKRFVEMVGELASGQQSQATTMAPLGFKVYYLRYAWAHDVTAQFGGGTTVIPGVASILRALLTTSSRSSAPPPLTQFRSGAEQSLRDQGLRRQGTLGAQGANPMMPTADTVQQAWGGRPGGVEVAVVDARMLEGLRETQGSSQARVEADTRLNAVIVRDMPDRLPYYDELIKSLDVEPQAIEIESTIIDLSTDKLRELGINWRFSGDRASFLFGNGTRSDTSLLGTTPVQDITPLGQGGFLSLVLGGRNNFIARINALQNQGVARVVSSPQIMTLSNVEALFDNNRSFYVRVAGREEVDLFKVSAGTTLRVTPHVFQDGKDVRIKLLVQIEDGQISTTEQVDQIPVVERSSINTQALIVAGESLLIGGMVRERTYQGVTKVPFLGDIPLLGHLFKTNKDGAERVERLFLISPRLVPARRPMSATAPTGPQRPGGAVAVPPMPAHEEPAWLKRQDGATPKPSDQPAAGEQ
ncbi:type III secretion system outer membrane ring subunit SctC [Ottowia testudinis]|uniref:Type 3 secretion system secretin n=1 Tax=Ottowia testudinis TaxID=2816950 RepID=A0A975H339_9BURK|nr:type III secretion system outer membrane ring subunit SctC [Ottowia testudinis]QTD45498.1 type III secretion system outer membrane ring subunit SctC [Ottowia testudinis]